MYWDEIFGRESMVQTLRAAVSTAQTAHAYLFYGPAGIGKKTIAGAFAAALNCTAGSGCGQCMACRKTASRCHPDIHWVVPEGKALKIEQIRRIRKHAYVKPQEGKIQVFILVDADTMTVEAANSLLKVLEEPPAGSVFILLAQTPAVLPPTVISRCLLFAVPRLDATSLERIIAACPLTVEEKALIIQRAEGIPGRALSLASSNELPKYRDEAAGLLRALCKGTRVSQTAAKLHEGENLTDFLDVMIYLLRDILIFQTVSNRSLLYEKKEGCVTELSALWTPAASYHALKLILALQKELQSPVNVRMALEKALRRLKEVIVNADGCGNSFQESG